MKLQQQLLPPLLVPCLHGHIDISIMLSCDKQTAMQEQRPLMTMSVTAVILRCEKSGGIQKSML